MKFHKRQEAWKTRRTLVTVDSVIGLPSAQKDIDVVPNVLVGLPSFKSTLFQNTLAFEKLPVGLCG